MARLVWTILGLIAALLIHGGAILFGGWFFLDDSKGKASVQPVDLLGQLEEEKEKPKPEEPKPDDREEIETQAEQPPDAAEVMRNLDMPAIDKTPALEAASLSAIEAALNGQGGGGDFAEALSFSSGGRIGGTGKGGSEEEQFEDAFSLAEIDQKPRAVFQASPVYPAQLRGKKIEAVVTLIFVVDEAGKVSNPQVEKSSDQAFESAAVHAVKKWKFEPGLRAGQRVATKMRVSIRFPAT